MTKSVALHPHAPILTVSYFVRSAVLYVKMLGALSAQLWTGLNLGANKSCLEESNSNLFIAHVRHLLHLIGYEEGQPDWSQDYRIGTNGNCYKILIYAIFQTKGYCRGNWPLSAETLITCQQWGYIFNTKTNDKIREIALELYCTEINLKGEVSARLKWIYELYKQLKKHRARKCWYSCHWLQANLCQTELFS